MYGCAACNQGIVIGGDLVRLSSAYKELGLRHSETYIPLAQLQAGTSAYWQLRVCVYVSCCTCSPLCPRFLEFHYMWTSTHMIGLTSCAIGKETSQCRVCTGAPICNIHPSLTLLPIWTHTGHTVQVCGFLDPPYMCYAPRSAPEWAYGCVHLAGLGVYFTWTVSCHVKTFL